jgi:hypothetical protein
MVFSLLSITFLLFTFGQLGRLSPFSIPVFGNLYEIILFFTGIILFWKYKLSKEVFLQPFTKSFLFFFGWLAITLVISLFYYQPIPNILAVLYFVRLIGYFIFYFYFVYHLQQSKNQEHKYQILIVSITSLICIFSLIQYFLYQNLGNLAYQGWDPHLYRLVGLFFDPPVTASVFFLLGLYIWLNVQNRFLKYGFVSFLLILFFLTYSRGGFLALLGTIIVFSIRKMNIKYLVMFVVLAVGLYVIIPKNLSEGLNLTRTTSISTRMKDYSKAISIWENHPLLGIGYNHIRVEKDSYEEEIITETYNPSHASSSFHSSFLIILVTSGVLGVILYIWFMGSFATINAFAFYSVVFLSIYSLTDNVLLYPFILFLLITLTALTTSQRKVDSAAHS